MTGEPTVIDFRNDQQRSNDRDAVAKVEAAYKAEFEKQQAHNALLRTEFDQIKQDMKDLSDKMAALQQTVADYQTAMQKNVREIEGSANNMAGLIEQMIAKSAEAMEATQRSIGDRVNKAKQDLANGASSKIGSENG